MQPTPGFLETLALHPALFVACCVLLGLLIGSFLNVVIYRVPIMMDNELRAECAEFAACETPATVAPTVAAEDVVIPEVTATPEVAASAEPPAASFEAVAAPEASPDTDQPETPKPPAFNLFVPRSACPHCKAPIKAQENIPVVSWLMLGGKCSSCGAPISKRYPLIELTTGVLSGVVAWHFGFGTAALAVLAFTWFLIALTMIDFDTQYLPDQLTYPLLWLGLLMSLTHPVWAPGAAPLSPRDSIIGAVVGYLTLWSVYWLYKALTDREGMGYGDFKLFAALGAWLGWQMILPVLVIASGVGAIVGVTLMILKGKDRNFEIPFGPFLATAGWLAMIFGHRFVDLYYSNFEVPG